MKKLPAVKNPGFRSGCLNCGPQPTTLSMKAVMSTGFGMVRVSCGKKTIWQGEDEKITAMRFENMARKFTSKDWRIFFLGPMSEAEYQRQGRNKWVLIRKGLGFA